MKNKLLIGALVGVATAIVVSVIAKKKNEKKYASVSSTPEQETNEVKEDDTDTKKKIAKATAKMTSWILEHKDDIEAVTLILSLTAATINLNNKVKDGRKAVQKTPTYDSLDWIVGDMIKHNIADAVVNCEGKAILDIHMKEVLSTS